MGYDFALLVQEYIVGKYPDSYKEILGESAHIAKIKSNPEKSKHLETATVRLCGIEVDFVNLRSETYQEGSRIPDSIVFGTPLEDAQRRDLTINSLFFNIHTGKVEDILNSGIDDLRKGVVRTPLPAFETFRDDPLRVLRLIRFASRFGYSVHEDCREAIMNPTIQQALSNCISRERVGAELGKMFSGPRPVLSIRLMLELGVFQTLFKIPSNALYSPTREPVSPSIIDNSVGKIVQRAITLQWALQSSQFRNLLLLPINNGNASSKTNYDEETLHRLMYTSVLLSPFRHLIIPAPKKTKTKKASDIFLNAYFCRDGLKLSTSETEAVLAFDEHVERIQEWTDRLASAPNLNIPKTREELGLLVQEIGMSGLSSVLIFDLKLHVGSRPLFDHYPYAFLYSAVFTLTYHLLNLTVHLSPQSKEKADQVCHIIDSTVAKYRALLKFLSAHDLLMFHQEKPMLDGSRILEYFQKNYNSSLKTGPWMMRLMGEQISWQLTEGCYGKRLKAMSDEERQMTEQRLFSHLQSVIEKGNLLNEYTQ